MRTPGRPKSIKVLRQPRVAIKNPPRRGTATVPRFEPGRIDG